MAEEDEALGAVKAVVGLVLFLFSSVMSGIVVMVEWGWFLVPLGVPPVKFWHAMGLGTLIGYLTKSVHDNKKSLLELMFDSLIISLFVLGFGYLFHLGMNATR